MYGCLKNGFVNKEVEIKIKDMIKLAVTEDIFEFVDLMPFGNLELHNIIVQNTYQNGDCGILTGCIKFSEDDGRTYNLIDKIKCKKQLKLKLMIRVFFEDENIEGNLNLNEKVFKKEGFNFYINDKDKKAAGLAKEIESKLGFEKIKLYKVVENNKLGITIEKYIVVADNGYKICMFEDPENFLYEEEFYKTFLKTVNDCLKLQLSRTEINKDNFDYYCESIKMIFY